MIETTSHVTEPSPCLGVQASGGHIFKDVMLFNAKKQQPHIGVIRVSPKRLNMYIELRARLMRQCGGDQQRDSDLTRLSVRQSR